MTKMFADFKKELDKEEKELKTLCGEFVREIINATISYFDVLPPLPGHPNSPYSAGPFSESHIIYKNGKEMSWNTLHFQKGSIIPGDAFVIHNTRYYAPLVLVKGWSSGTPPHETYERAVDAMNEFDLPMIIQKFQGDKVHIATPRNKGF